MVATDDERMRAAVDAHGIAACMTRADHPTGTDRLAEAARRLGLADDAIVVNVQGDEPLLEPALIRAVAELLAAHPDAAIATACHPIDDPAEAFNPNVVKVVLDAAGYALYFSRATIPWARDAFAAGRGALPPALAAVPALRPLRVPRALPARVPDARRPRRSSASRRWSSCARCGRPPDRRGDHRGHAGARRRHAGGSRAGPRALRRAAAHDAVPAPRDN